MPLRKPWESYDPAEWKELSGSYGVYELADVQDNVIYIGFAGSRSRFGLRGKIMDHFSEKEINPVIRDRVAKFRYEVNSMDYSRWVDLLGRFHEDHDKLPEGNEASNEHIPTLPRFRWKSWEVVER
jgi:hypothetical protein